MRTELKIYSSTEYVNIDLTDDEPIQLEMSIVDIQEPDQRRAEFTRSIKIPGTTNNNQYFSNIFEINSAVVGTSFNPNTKVNCILYKDGIPQLRGLLQLTNIIIIDEQEIYYEIVIIGRNANLFQDLGDKMLSELDLSAYDHTWDSTNIDASWTASIGEGYVYPLIDRGYASAEIFYNYNQTFPATYIKTLVDAIFSEAGYRYSSTFFSSTIFKSLILPYTGDGFRMTKAEVEDRLFNIGFNSASAFIPMSTGTPIKVLFPNIIKDTVPPAISSNQWTVPTGYLGNYILRGEFDLTVKYNGASSYTDDTLVFEGRIMLDRGGVITNLAPFNQTITIQWVGSISNGSTIGFNFANQCPLTSLEDGDIVYMDWSIVSYKNIFTPTDIEVRFNAGTAFFNSSDGIYNFGALIQLSNALPKDFKQADLLKGLIKMFNLYIEPDKIDDKKLIVEPRDDFYTNNIVDLTEKLDVSRDYMIVPMGALQWKSLEFHYQKDNDEYNKKYLEQYVNEYGYKRETVNNDFLTEVKKIEIPFAPTPLADASTNDRTISKIRFFNAAGQRESTVAKPRILYYGGLITTGYGTYSLGSSLLPDFRTSFAYAGHLDNVANPTFDLSFSMPEMVYFGAGTQPTLTDNNLYNKYWKKTIDEITDKDSKILKCSIHFTNVDLQNISFRNYYFIDGQYYRLYKIETNLNSDEPAQCEFLKLKVAPVFVPTQGSANGGIGTIGGDILPVLEYYNYGEFVEQEKQAALEVADRTAFEVVTVDTQLTAESKIIGSENTITITLPRAANSNPTGDRTIQITIVNASTTGSEIITVDTTGGALINGATSIELTNNSSTTLVTNGTDWFQI